MKTKLIGLGILAAVIIAAAAYVFISNSQTVTEINGYVGGEKIGLLEDEEVQDILRDRYRLVIDYAKAGSIDMVTDDAEGRDFLFPSNQTALELYKQVHGDPVKSEIILNTPIVLYTRSAVAQALVDSGLAVVTNGVYTVDMEKLTETIEAGTTWEEIGLPQLYGSVSVGTTDPTKSNSGNMFAGLLANTLCGGVADGDPAPAAKYFSEAGVYGKLLLGFVRSVSEDRHGCQASDRRLRKPAAGIRRGKPGYLGADQGGHCDDVPNAHRLVLPCVYRPG